MSSNQRYLAEVSYRGTHYHGWQRQPNAVSVQQVIEENMGKFLPAFEGIVASGRTDAGVHCTQQFFHFDVPHDTELGDFPFKMNRMLPHDIAIHSIRKIHKESHARFDATRRSYIYRISRRKDVFTHGLTWLFGGEVDINKMNEAAAVLQTFQDFQSLSKVNTDVNHFLCTIYEARWLQSNNELQFHITGNRFLRGMVRAIVGTCIDIGRGRLTVEAFKEVLESKDRRNAGPSAPPEGLYLSRVDYPEQIFLD